MRRVSLAIGLVALGSMVLAAPAVANNSWGGYHWERSANPFTITLGDNVDSSWDAVLAGAASDWSADTAGNPLNATIATGSAKGRNCKPPAGGVEVCNGPYGYNGWSGIAQIWIGSDGHITQGSAQMNDTYMNGLPAVSRAHVMCQEVGHTFGLDHQDESGADLGTCMDYADAFDNAHPNFHDYGQLATIYGHLDTASPNTKPGKGNGKGRGDLATRPGAEPSRVERTDRRHSSKIVEHFADGSHKVTFIDWAA